MLINDRKCSTETPASMTVYVTARLHVDVITRHVQQPVAIVVLLCTYRALRIQTTHTVTISHNQ